MRILVTGANGFVASTLIPDLLASDHAVIGVARSVKKYHGPKIELIQLDIDEEVDWGKFLVNVDVVIHLAARVHQMNENSYNPLDQYMRTNHDSTKSLAEASLKAKVKNFVFMSTSKVYGEESHERPFALSDAGNTDDPYGLSKFRAEKTLIQIFENTKTSLTILRPPLVFGPRVKGNFKKLLEISNTGYPLPLGSINNKRSLVSVWNLSDTICQAAKRSSKGVIICNVSDEQSVSTAELVSIMRLAMGRPKRIFPFPVGILKTVAKILGQSKALFRLTQNLELSNESSIAQFSSSRKMSLNDGINQTVEWFINKDLKDE